MFISLEAPVRIAFLNFSASKYLIGSPPFLQSFTRRLNNVLTIASKIAPMNAGQNPVTTKPFTTLEVIINRKALITNVKTPRVRVFRGSVRKRRTGLKIEFRMPSTRHATKRGTIPVTSMPSII